MENANKTVNKVKLATTDIQFGSQVQMILISVPVVSTEIHVRGCIPVGIGDSESIYAQ
jgi:hypothetical protein